MDAKASAMAHPVFGDIKDDPKVDRMDSKGSTIKEAPILQEDFKKLRVGQRPQFVRSQGLC